MRQLIDKAAGIIEMRMAAERSYRMNREMLFTHKKQYSVYIGIRSVEISAINILILFSILGFCDFLGVYNFFSNL